MRNETYPPKATFESAWAIVQKNAKTMEAMQAQSKKDDKKFKAKLAKSDESLKKWIEQCKKDDKKFYAKLAKSDESFKKWLEQLEIDREKRAQDHDRDHENFKKWIEQAEVESKRFYDSIKAMQQELGGISNSNGAVAESYFVNSFNTCMQFAGQEYDEIDRNLRKKSKKLSLQSEYDLVLYNCTSVVIIEIKYKAREKDVVKLLAKAPIFKQLYPQYANYDMYLGLAAFHFEENTENDSIEHGIAVIKQIGDTMVINDAHLKIF